MCVGYCDDDNLAGLHPVHNAVRKPLEQIPTCIVFVVRPRRGCPLDLGDSDIQLVAESYSGSPTASAVSAGSFLGFFQRFVEEFKRADHGRRLPESGVELPTTGSASPVQNPDARAVAESLQTTPLQRPRRPVHRGSGSAPPQVPHVVPGEARAPRRATA